VREHRRSRAPLATIPAKTYTLNVRDAHLDEAIRVCGLVGNSGFEITSVSLNIA